MTDARGRGCQVRDTLTFRTPAAAAILARSSLRTRGYPVSDEYERLVARERRIVSQRGAQLEAIGVLWADAQPRWERALAQQGSPCPIREDFHSLAPGYRIHADAALQLIHADRAP